MTDLTDNTVVRPSGRHGPVSGPLLLSVPRRHHKGGGEYKHAHLNSGTFHFSSSSGTFAIHLPGVSMPRDAPISPPAHRLSDSSGRKLYPARELSSALMALNGWISGGKKTSGKARSSL